MLVLSRKKNESIVINNDVIITVVEIRGDKVRLGIVAPKEVPVHRQEVYDAIQGTDRTSTTPSMVVSDNPEKRP
jgi:carbon storage regulator